MCRLEKEALSSAEIFHNLKKKIAKNNVYFWHKANAAHSKSRRQLWKDQLKQIQKRNTDPKGASIIVALLSTVSQYIYE